MKESIMIAIEIYLIAFVVSLLMAGLIKGMHSILRRMSPETEAKEE